MGLFKWARDKERVSTRSGFYIMFSLAAFIILVGLVFLAIGVFHNPTSQFSVAFGLGYIPIGIFFIYRAIDGAREKKG
jgi:uncharacterized membrane protein YidH (DUF202 family)